MPPNLTYQLVGALDMWISK